MVILGVDPGVAHTGVVVLDGNRAVFNTTLVPSTEGRLTIEDVLRYVLPPLRQIVRRFEPEAAAVEQVAWYGRARRITLPLSHIAGGIAGALWAMGVPVYFLVANMKTSKLRIRKSWDEHQKDAALLAKVVQNYRTASNAGDLLYLKKHSAVGKRIISAPEPAPTFPTKLVR